jgi:hypothetical protein
MGNKGIFYDFKGATTSIDSYNPNKLNLSNLIKSYDDFVGPIKIGMARPMESGFPSSAIYPHVINISEDKDWVFLGDGSAVAATRRIIAYEFDKRTSVFNWLGYITLQYPIAGNVTMRGMRVLRDLYSQGTVSVSGSTVTGVNTDWVTNNLCVGYRIGFGSTNPNQITKWYEITGINSNTSLNTNIQPDGLITNAPYVIECLTIVVAQTNATVTNGGLFVVKGINIDIFGAGAIIPAATTIDNIRAVYWLADSAVNTNTTIAGCAIGDYVDRNNQNIYCLDVTTRKLYVYNVRAKLNNLVSGRTLDGFNFATGTLQSAFTGVLSQVNNGRIASLKHGPGANTPCLYFVTTTRVYRAALNLIVDGSTTWVSDMMSEIPPGGIATYAITNAFSNIEYDSMIDKLIIMTTGAASVRSYITKYNTNSEAFDHIFLVDDKQLDQSSADQGGVPHPSINTSPFTVWSENGLLYMCRTSTAATLNQIYTLPIGAHRKYAFENKQFIITPKMDLMGVNRILSVSATSINELGSDTFSLPTEPYSMYYRINGIDDNTGEWIKVPENGRFNNLFSKFIQFAFTFKVIGTTCIPSRISGLSLQYEDDSTDSHYEPSIANSSIVDRHIAYRQKMMWNSTIPNLRIRLINADTGIVVIDDTVINSQYGYWQYSVNNGTTWLQWDNTADLTGNYIRYTPNSIPPGTKIRSLLTIN